MYGDFYMLRNIFGVGEILAMTPDFIECLETLLDDKLSVRIKEFFTRFEESGLRHKDEPIAIGVTEKVDLMHKILDDTIKSRTFHIEVQERDAVAQIEAITLETALSVIRDRDKTEETLSWLLENRKYWRANIDERRKGNYETFLEHVGHFSSTIVALEYAFKEVGYHVHIPAYENLLRRVKENKELFYAPNERKRSTRMGIIMSSAPTMEAVLHGIRYQKRCDEKKIPRMERRFF